MAYVEHGYLVSGRWIESRNQITMFNVDVTGRRDLGIWI
jgi:hypothetical protein